jgi:hypothetical protein
LGDIVSGFGVVVAEAVVVEVSFNVFILALVAIRIVMRLVLLLAHSVLAFKRPHPRRLALLIVEG